MHNWYLMDSLPKVTVALHIYFTGFFSNTKLNLINGCQNSVFDWAEEKSLFLLLHLKLWDVCEMNGSKMQPYLTH